MHYIINYHTIRIMLILFVLIPLIKFNNLGKKIIKLDDGDIVYHNSKKSRFILLLFYIIFIYIISVIPYEKVLLKNRTIESVIKYYYPFGRVISKYELDNYVYVYYREYRSYSFSSFKKNDEVWKKNKNIKKDKQFNLFLDADITCLIRNEIIDGKNSTALLLIIYTSDKNERFEISNSMNSEFKRDESYNKKILGVDEYEYFYFIELNKELDRHYVITINDKEYKVFDYIKK